MKRIVILCDGTWNRSDAEHPTNVVRLAQALAAVDAGGVVQVPIYLEGVGSGRGVTRLDRATDRVLGGAMGLGLMANVAAAYRNLVFLYEPGDEVYVFGFSRGAFTARSLAGFIRSTGIIDRDKLHEIPAAVARYRDADSKTHPGSPESHAYRARISSRVVTSPAEAAWRADAGMDAVPRLRIAYLGVWDTVGALGVPNHWLLGPLLNGTRFRFHDANLSSLVARARHAIALDERRRTFEPTRWQNLPQLRAEAEGAPERYRERFFAGDHGAVGGGGAVRDVASITLGWIIEGAEAAGLAFEPKWRAHFRSQEDPVGLITAHDPPRRSLVERAMRLRARDRAGPDRMEELHPSVLTRLGFRTKSADFTPYRPGSLARLAADIDTWLAETLDPDGCRDRTDARRVGSSAAPR